MMGYFHEEATLCSQVSQEEEEGVKLSQALF